MKKFVLAGLFLALTVSVLFAAGLNESDKDFINAIKGFIYVVQAVAGLYCLYEILIGAMKMGGNGEEGKKHLMQAVIGLLIVIMLFPIADLVLGKAKNEGKTDTSNIESLIRP
jgi:hypothetical protein